MLAQRDRVGEDHFLERRSIDTLGSRITQHSVAGYSADATSAILHHQVSSLTDRPCRINDIVHEDDVLIRNIPDDRHLSDFIGLSTALMADDHGHAEELSIGVSTLGTTDVRRSDDRTLKIRRLAQVVDEDHRSIEVVHRHVEEALDLVSMQVHSDDARDPCRAQ